jgi:hypothetical protein
MKSKAIRWVRHVALSRDELKRRYQLEEIRIDRMKMLKCILRRRYEYMNWM